MPQQSDEVFKRRHIVELCDVNQAHKHIADPCAVERFIKQGRLSMQDYLTVILPISGNRLKSTIAGIHATGVV